VSMDRRKSSITRSAEAATYVKHGAGRIEYKECGGSGICGIAWSRRIGQGGGGLRICEHGRRKDRSRSLEQQHV
jgi:hypothetical protein